MADLVRKTGDTTTIYGTLLDGNADTVDIQGATVRFHMRRRGSGPVKIAAAATNAQVGDGSDGTRGNVTFTPTGAQVNEAGRFDYEWEVTFAGGAVQTYPEGRYLLALFTEGLA